MKHIEINKSKGYSDHGAKGRSSYVREITGLNGSGFDGEFMKADSIDWGESELYRKDKGTWTEKYDLSRGVYEVSEYGDRKYFIVTRTADYQISRDDLYAGLQAVDKTSIYEGLSKYLDHLSKYFDGSKSLPEWTSDFIAEYSE